MRRTPSGASLAAPLVVQYRDPAGRARSGVTARLESVAVDGGLRVFLNPGQGPPFQLVFVDTTDTAGQVRARIGFGLSAGPGLVRATAPTLGLSDSTSYFVRPGALTRLELAPADTALYVAATVQFRARTFDRWGNIRGDTPSWSTTAGVVEPTAPGQVRGLTIGRAVVRASVESTAESVGVSVVPHGVIAAVFFPIAVGDPYYLLTFNTDGSGLRRIDVGADCAHGLQWSPAGDQLLFGKNPSPGICFTQRLYTTTLGGTVHRIRPDTMPLAGEYWPQMTADGQWVYFTGQPGSQNGEIWRVRPDGSIGPPAGYGDLDQHPSPSPSGSEVVYHSSRAPDWVFTLRVVDTTTRVVRDLGINGTWPSSSPKGDLIAFMRDGRYWVVGADGSGERLIVDSLYSPGQDEPPSWSPDERWLVVEIRDPGGYAPIYGRLGLAEVATGIVLPLGWTAQLTYPSWRPVDTPVGASYRRGVSKTAGVNGFRP